MLLRDNNSSLRLGTLAKTSGWSAEMLLLDASNLVNRGDISSKINSVNEFWDKSKYCKDGNRAAREF